MARKRRAIGLSVAAGRLFRHRAAKGQDPAYDAKVKGFDHDGKKMSGINGVNFTAYAVSGYGALVDMGSFLIAPRAEILTGPGPDKTMAATVHE